MSIEDGFTAIPPGKIAALVTFLEMQRPVAMPPVPPLDSGWAFDRIERPEPAFYTDLYRRIGAEHLWYGRLTLSQTDLARTLADENLVIHVLTVDGVPQGLVEIDFNAEDRAELVYFGVTSSLVGTRAARAMMSRAIAIGFSRGASRFWLHTNTIDHARALAFYRRSGFVPVRQAVEVADDPRLTGIYPRGVAPHVPILGG